tara:strand:- start:37 stop:474 length:438 start_codon:yes stop_codon:yes gene_type:complete
MLKKTQILFIIFFLFIFPNKLIANENFFLKAKIKYEEKKYDESKFLFQRNVVFNPKDSKSYLYLAKIYHNEKNETEEEKNLNTTLLLEPNNEEAILMLMEMSLKKSNYAKVKDLSKNFKKVCKQLCDKNQNILEKLKNIEPKNES